MFLDEERSAHYSFISIKHSNGYLVVIGFEKYSLMSELTAFLITKVFLERKMMLFQKSCKIAFYREFKACFVTLLPFITLYLNGKNYQLFVSIFNNKIFRRKNILLNKGKIHA